MSCISLEACSATADCWTFPDTRALLCSFRRWSNVCRLPPLLPPEVCPGGAYQDRTPHNEQRRRPTTNGIQPTNPTSKPALLKTCCCFYIVLYFLLIIIYYNLHCTYPNLVLYIACLHFIHQLSGGITIISRQKWLFFPLLRV